MKKLAFSAFAVLAVVGSALAFTSPSDVVFCDDPATLNVIDCTIETPGRLDAVSAPKFIDNCSATDGEIDCPQVQVYTEL